jgi:Tol biopolymer transport system component
VSLQHGSRIGPYEVTAQIGEGGMGVVYRATDSNLARTVAIKVLPAVFAQDAERVARFEREARTLAALNHPNIAHIYGLERGQGQIALVMELVEGATLADRIAQGPVPVEEALEIARQVAEALEAAHEQGIVHRDLKPANIKVRPDGTVKVLDFGLARAMDAISRPDTSHLATLTSPAQMTGVGVVLGTAAYMSPEQAKGRPVDRRADIWAFGVVLTELLTGRTVFAGESVTETLASVMKDDPVIPDAPPAVQHLLRRCLQRDPRRRLRDIGEARIVLEDPSAADRERASQAPAAQPRVLRRSWVSVAAVVLTGIAAGAGGWALRPTPAADAVPLRKFMLPVEGLQAGPTRAPQLSPDGTKLVYVRGDRLFLRDLTTLEPRELTTAPDPRYFLWSPDSTQVAYISGDRLWKVPITGGSPVVVTVLRQSLGNGVGAAWGTDGRIVLTTAMPGTGLQQVSADGGDLTTLVAPEPPGEQDFHDVTILPDNRGLLYALDRGSGVVDTIAVFTGETKKAILHLEGETLRAPVYAATGHVLYERTTNNAGIWALPFSLSTLETTGEPFLISAQSALPSLSRDGTLMFLPQAPAAPLELLSVDATGKALATIGPPKVGLREPRISPDGRHVAAGALANGRYDVWIYDMMRGGQTRLTFGEGDEMPQTWSPSGDRVFFARNLPPAQTRTIAAQAADGTGQVAEIVASKVVTGADVSRDGKFVVYADAGNDPSKTGQDLWYVALDGEKKSPTVFVDAPNAQGEPRVSPDGRYLAYFSNESGRPEVYVKPFPSGDGKWQVSVNGGTAPRWSASGDRIFFVEPGQDTRVMQADIVTSPALNIGTPKFLFSVASTGRRLANGWDVFPDGRRFLLIAQVENDKTPQTPAITLVQNWFAEFRERHAPR